MSATFSIGSGCASTGRSRRPRRCFYGTKFLPDYPQALLKLGRFRGTKITGDILDNKQEYLHAFAMVREAIAWLDRTLPRSARFPPGAINREDRLPVPAEALREILINAVIHRDVSNPSSYIAIAVFDDRIEIHSIVSFRQACVNRSAPRGDDVGAARMPRRTSHGTSQTRRGRQPTSGEAARSDHAVAADS